MRPDDDELRLRIRRALSRRGDVVEQPMFGGIAFLIGGRVCCGPWRGMLLLRLGDAGAESALDLPHTRPVAFGKPINSMIFVEPAGFADDAALRAWLKKSLAFLATQPAKPKSPRKRGRIAVPPAKRRVAR